MGIFEVLSYQNIVSVQVSPFTIPALLGNTASGVIGIEIGCRGPNYGVTSACASGGHAIGEALGMILDGHADAMIAGGAEELCPTQAAVFDTIMAASTIEDPAASPRPFDSGRVHLQV